MCVFAARFECVRSIVRPANVLYDFGVGIFPCSSALFFGLCALFPAAVIPSIAMCDAIQNTTEYKKQYFVVSGRRASVCVCMAVDHNHNIIVAEMAQESEGKMPNKNLHTFSIDQHPTGVDPVVGCTPSRLCCYRLYLYAANVFHYTAFFFLVTDFCLG